MNCKPPKFEMLLWWQQQQQFGHRQKETWSGGNNSKYKIKFAWDTGRGQIAMEGIACLIDI